MNLEVKYFTQLGCSVCVDLKPRLRQAIESVLPEVQWTEINASENPEIAAQHNVFTVPVVIIFAEGREHDRFVRVFPVDEVVQKVSRLYQLLNE